MTTPPRPAPAAAPSRGRALAACALFGALGVAACLSVAPLEPNLVEEGLVLHVAQRLAHGEHLYRDVLFFSGPLPFELLAALFRLFGEEIAVGRVAQALFHGAATAATFALARGAGAGALAPLAAACVAAAPLALFPLLSMFYYTPLALSLGTLAAWAAWRGARGETRGAALCALAGALVGGVALCKQTVGVALALGLLACVASQAPAARRRARAAAFVAGGAALAAATVLFYGARGDLAAAVRCLVAVPLSLDEAYRSGFMNLWPPGRLAPELQPFTALYFPNLWVLVAGVYAQPGFAMVLLTQLLYALPLLALAATLVARLAGPLPGALACHGALLAALATNLFPRSDWGHLAFALPSACVQAVLLAAPLARRARVPARALASASAAATLAVAGAAVGSAVWLGRQAGRATFGPRVPLRPVSEVLLGPALPRVIHFLRERVEPGEPIFVARAEPLVYFATDTTNPTPYGGVLPALQDEQQRVIVEALARTRYVVMSDVDQPMWTYYADELPLVQQELERHYELPRYFPVDAATWLLVLERGADRGPTALDLVALRANARAFVRDAPGEEREDREPLPRLITRQNRRPLAMRVGRFGGGLDYALEVPPGGHFEASVGLRQAAALEGLLAAPTRSRLRVSVRREGGAFEELASWHTEDRKGAGRRWSELAADLAPWSGERVTLRLELVPDAPLPKPALAWWGSPRIALPPPPGAAPEAQRDAPAPERR